MEIKITKSRAVTVVVPKGDLDTASTAQMRQALAELINAGKSRLVVDLRHVGYMDSAGLGELVTAMKRARKAGGDLRLCGPNADISRILEMTRLDRQMGLYPTRQGALASWK